MTAFAFESAAAGGPATRGTRLPAWRGTLAALSARAWAGDRTLVLFGAVLIVLALACAAGLVLDPRTLRGVSVWVKPVKFAVSVAVLAWTTALFSGWLDAGYRRRSRALDALRGLFLLTATFEIFYITVQAALGQASHFNDSDAFHRTMFALMGAGALALAATQPWLAVLIARHGARDLEPALRQSIVLGLWLSFALGCIAGVGIAGMAPPANGGLPVLGWTFGSGDLRPAHFVGMHAAQVLPLFAAWTVWRRSPRAVALVRAAAGGWVLLFVGALVAAFAGAVGG